MTAPEASVHPLHPSVADSPRRWQARWGAVRWDVITMLFITTVVAGAALRFSGVFFGLPLLLHADEWVVVEGAIDMSTRNSFEPPFFMRPDHLEIQLSYVVYQMWSHVYGGGSPEALFAQDPAPFYALSRIVTAAFGTAMIPVAYAIGTTVARRAGLLMAAVIAFFPPFVEHSHYATPDIPLTFSILIVILGCVRYARSASWWALALATFGVAMGTTAKYPALLAASAIAATVIVTAIRSKRPLQIVTRGAAALAMLPVMIFVLSPVLFTNFAEVRRQLFQQNSTGHLGADGLDWTGNLAFYAHDFVTNAGVILCLFALLGIVWTVRNRLWGVLAPLLCGVVFWLAISALSLHWDRWGLPMYVTPLLFAALGIHAGMDLAARVAAPLPRRIGRICVNGLSVLAGAHLVIASVAVAALALAPDTRTVSGRELPQLGVSSEDTYYDGYTPFLTDGPRSLTTDLTVDSGAIVPISDPPSRRYILTSSNMTNRFTRDPESEGYLLYTTIDETLSPVASWRPSGGASPAIFEPVAIGENTALIFRLLTGGMTGPAIELFRMPVP